MLVSLCANELGLSIRNFVKMTLTRVSNHWQWVEPFCEKRDSSRVWIWKTWITLLVSRAVVLFLNVTQVESESTKIVTRVTLSLATCIQNILHTWKSLMFSCLSSPTDWP